MEYESGKAKLEQLYDKLHKNSEGREDDSIEKLIIFSAMINMATNDKKDKCTVFLNNHGGIIFYINGKSIFSQVIDNTSHAIILNIFLEHNLSIPNSDSYLIKDANKLEEFNLLYNKLHKKNENKFKIVTFRNICNVMIFSQIRDLAPHNKKDKFMVSVREGKMVFSISGVSIHTESISEHSSQFIQNSLLGFNQTMLDTEELIIPIKKIMDEKIRNYFIPYGKRLVEIKNHAINTMKEFVKLVYAGTYLKHEGIIYYYDVEKKYCKSVIYAPGTEPESKLTGKSKQVKKMDHRFVTLIPNLESQDNLPDNSSDLGHFNEFKHENNKYYNELSELNAIIDGLVVDHGLIIMRNAGDNLYRLIFDDKIIIGIMSFTNVLFELKKLHTNGIYITDIKLGNLTYDEKSEEVRMIDVQNRVRKGEKHKKIGHTNRYVTVQVYSYCTERVDPNSEEMHDSNYHYLRVADEYAILICMMQSTTGDRVFRSPSPSNVGEKWNHHGIMNYKNQDIISDWIDHYVQLEFREHVKKFLTNPAKAADESPDRKYLADMLSIQNGQFVQNF
ncbi:hypothetical protein [Candidatus Fukatsuia endosymbiont of Tuberolachnus salignus]|uniref:hypothetical protein n=1 Tax=Candidatus Fukatsuia endosymbiont of Tuberolachnus salignus TaxID=3077957 RepID=UPI00313E4D40